MLIAQIVGRKETDLFESESNSWQQLPTLARARISHTILIQDCKTLDCLYITMTTHSQIYTDNRMLRGGDEEEETN